MVARHPEHLHLQEEGTMAFHGEGNRRVYFNLDGAYEGTAGPYLIHTARIFQAASRANDSRCDVAMDIVIRLDAYARGRVHLKAPDLETHVLIGDDEQILSITDLINLTVALANRSNKLNSSLCTRRRKKPDRKGNCGTDPSMWTTLERRPFHKFADR